MNKKLTLAASFRNKFFEMSDQNKVAEGASIKISKTAMLE
jgi:hypothetical protein